MGCATCFKRFIRAVVPHIIVISALFGYLILGAAVFSYLETGHSDVEVVYSEVGEFLDKVRNNTTDRGLLVGVPGEYDVNGTADVPGVVMASAARPPDVGSTAKTADMAEVVDEELLRSIRPEWTWGRMQAVKSKRAWSFSSSMLFCLTTITTIGYGDVVPVTVWGKIFCVIYSVFGIPLVMLYMAGVGTFLAHLILTLIKIVRLGKPLRRALCSCCSGRNEEEGSNSSFDENGSAASKKNGRSRKGKKAGGGSSGSMDSKVNGTELEEIVTKQHGVDSSVGEGSGGGGNGQVQDIEMEAPVLLVVAIMTGYMCAGAFMMSGIEEWTYGEALYFTFITLTTIGFGDYVPTMLYKEDAYFVCIIYALFGLAVMSMCIALVQAKVRRLGDRVWECIGC